MEDSYLFTAEFDLATAFGASESSVTYMASVPWSATVQSMDALFTQGASPSGEMPRVEIDGSVIEDQEDSAIPLERLVVEVTTPGAALRLPRGWTGLPPGVLRVEVRQLSGNAGQFAKLFLFIHAVRGKAVS